jgi:hypothetical protein
MESIIYFSDNVFDDVVRENPLYLSVFKNRMSELNEFIERNPILIQTLTHEQKTSLRRNIEHLNKQIEGSYLKEVTQKISSYILSFLEREAITEDPKSVSLQAISDTESLETFIRVTLEKNTTHVSEVAEALLSMPESLISLRSDLLHRFVLVLADVNAPLVLRNIKKFQITDPMIYEQIAHIALQKSPGWLCAHVQDLNLSKPVLEKVAREIAPKACAAFVLHIENFNIDNPALLEELALMVAKENPDLFSENVMKFHLQNEEVRRALAVRISEINPYVLAHNIGNFELMNDLGIEIIFSKFSEIDPELIAEYFRVPSENSGSIVEKVALFVASEKPNLLANYVDSFKLTDDDILEVLFSTIAQKEPKYFLENFQNFGIRDRSFFSKVIIKMAIAHPDFTFNNLEKFVLSPQDLPRFLSIILEGYVQFYLSLANQNNAFSKKDAEKFIGLWEKAASTLANTNRYRNMAISVYLVMSFCNMFMNSKSFKENMLQLNGGSLVAYKIRPSILPAKWIAESVKDANNLSEEIAIITQFLHKRKKDFCEASPANLSASLLHNYLLTARILDTAPFLADQKVALLSRILSKTDASNADVCQKLILVNILCSKNIGIENISWNSIGDLVNILNESIKDGSFGNLEDIEDLSVAYANTFGNLRIPYALETYQACIKEVCHEEPLVQDAFEWFVHSVLKRTFPSERYRTDNNPHLKHIENYDASLLGEWKKSLNLSAQGLSHFSDLFTGSGPWEIVETDDYQDLLLSGTEVSGSCLRIDGEAIKNKCLLSYLMDGKMRLLAIKNRETGKIAFRSILRLLWDAENNRPVLFQDFIYPAVQDPEMKTALQEASIAKAKSLNVPLLTSCGDDAEMYEGNATSFGSSCPYEYVDSAGGVTEGRYSIRHTQVLFTPDAK